MTPRRDEIEKVLNWLETFPDHPACITKTEAVEIVRLARLGLAGADLRDALLQLRCTLKRAQLNDALDAADRALEWPARRHEDVRSLVAGKLTEIELSAQIEKQVQKERAEEDAAHLKLDSQRDDYESWGP